MVLIDKKINKQVLRGHATEHYQIVYVHWAIKQKTKKEFGKLK
jgi:hypothetical protein